MFRPLRQLLASGAPCAALLAAWLVPAPALAAHELPERVVVHVLTQQRGDRVRMLVRIPVEALRDISWPLDADGVQLRMEHAQRLAVEAAQLWVVPGVLADRQRGSAGRTSPSGSPDGSATRVIAAVIRAPSDAAVTDVSRTRHFDTVWETLRRDAADAAERLRVIDRAPEHASAGERLIPWTQTVLDVALEMPLPRAYLTTAFAHLGVRTTIQLRVHAGSDRERALVLTGDAENLPLEPTALDAIRRFFTLGVVHILGGIDHLLFVLCLVIPVRRVRPLVALITAFTVAHSITLAAAALGAAPDGAWFPPLVETLIAASIVALALENIMREPRRLERRWPAAFVFGLVHGFGFSFALGESLQLAGAQHVAALAAFNVGVEVGQLAVIAVAVPVVGALLTRVSRPRLLVGVASALIGHVAWHWMTERGGEALTYARANGWLGPLG